jgi:hypothetical protein
MYATCFGMYLDHRQAIQHKERIPEETIKIQWVPLGILLYLSVYFFRFDMAEDDLSTDRNMCLTCDGNAVDRNKVVLCYTEKYVGVPPYSRVIRSKTYRGYLKPLPRLFETADNMERYM